jgi:proteasome lid subunit RPN8/RPN11
MPGATAGHRTGGQEYCGVIYQRAEGGGYFHADYHSHPALTTFSPEDLQARRQRFYFRVMFNPSCAVYLYDFQARTVYQLDGGRFVPLKRVTDDLRGE